MTGDSIIAEYLPEILCFGVDAIICGLVYKAYSSTNYLINEIKGAPKIDLDDGDLATLVSKHKNLLKNGEDGQFLPYVVVSGKVSAEDTSQLLANNTIIKTGTPSVKGVFRETSIIEHKRTLSRTGFWYDSRRTINAYTNEIPFYLIPMSKSCAKRAKPNLIEVKDIARASRLDLEVVSDHFDTAPGGIGDHLVGFMLGDKPKGIQTTEKMLREGTSLTIVGELVKTQQDKFRMREPSNGLNYLMIKDSMKVLIEDLQSESKMLKIGLYIFGGLGVFIVGFAAYRYWKSTEQRRRSEATRRRLEQIIEERPSRAAAARPDPNIQLAEDSDDTTTSSQTCVVCYQEPKEVIFLDCGHVCACAECAMSVMRTNPVCPICRAAITRVVPAYIS